MQEACASAIDAGSIVGVVNVAALEALGRVGLRDGIGNEIEDTPWARPTAAYATHGWEHDVVGLALDTADGGRALYHHQLWTRYEVVVDAVPGGLSGRAWCWFVEDLGRRDFWFWKLGDDTYLVREEPKARVSLTTTST